MEGPSKKEILFSNNAHHAYKFNIGLQTIIWIMLNTAGGLPEKPVLGLSSWPPKEVIGSLKPC